MYIALFQLVIRAFFHALILDWQGLVVILVTVTLVIRQHDKCTQSVFSLLCLSNRCPLYTHPFQRNSAAPWGLFCTQLFHHAKNYSFSCIYALVHYKSQFSFIVNSADAYKSQIMYEYSANSVMSGEFVYQNRSRSDILKDRKLLTNLTQLVQEPLFVGEKDRLCNRVTWQLKIRMNLLYWNTWVHRVTLVNSSWETQANWETRSLALTSTPRANFVRMLNSKGFAFAIHQKYIVFVNFTSETFQLYFSLATM